MQTLVSVVTRKERKMLGALTAARNEVSYLLRHGLIKLPAYRERLNYLLVVISAEQGKPISLPARGSEAVKRIDGGAGIGIARKRMLPCNRADRLRPVKLLIVIVLRKKFSSVRTSSPMTSTLGVIAGRQRPVM